MRTEEKLRSRENLGSGFPERASAYLGRESELRPKKRLYLALDSCLGFACAGGSLFEPDGL
jgi:hypothetical protein